MSIFDREANDIVAYLQRSGYQAKVDRENSVIVVQDMEWSLPTSEGSGKQIPVEVRFNGWEKAIKFVSERD